MFDRYFLLDTKPVPVVGYKRSKAHSAFAGSTDYGVCVSRNLHDFGSKLVMVTTRDGLAVVSELVPANTDEREAADEILVVLWNCYVLTDKGFIDEEWQAGLETATGPPHLEREAQEPADTKPSRV